MTVFAQKNCLQAKCDFTRKTAILGGLGAAYDVHLSLIGKLVVDVLLVIIERF